MNPLLMVFLLHSNKRGESIENRKLATNMTASMVIKAVLVLPTDQVGSLLIKPDVATAVFIIHAVFLNPLFSADFPKMT